MSGHSKWAKIKRSKGNADAARGRIFSRLIREITIAARMGGGNIDGNPRLRSAIASARSNNMPGKNIDNAIAKGTGTLEGITFEEFSLEGYAPGGVAVLIDCMSDNRNRSISEVRHAMTKAGGNLAAVNSVAWMFKAKGIIRVPKSAMDEDSLMETVLNAGADDLSSDDEEYEISTPVESFVDVQAAIEKIGVKPSSAELTKVPENTVRLEGDQAIKVLRLLDELDELDDAQKVHSNLDVSDEVMEKYSKEE
jgi:YebC/PmpR family DNA-binding regulatory protein